MSDTIEKWRLWELADDWEARWKDKRHVPPIDRYVWKKAWTELCERLGEREFPKK